jgi:hypothetical protein
MRPLHVLVPLLLAAAAAPAHAQLTMVRTGGTLGGPLQHTVTGGEPFDAFVWIPSGNTGPTPLAPFDPLDARSLEVGFDLLSNWVIGGLSATGDVTLSQTLPATPSLAGIAIHAQTISLPGSPTLVDGISNRTAFRLGASGGSTFTVANQPLGISAHSATALPGGDVLLIGGEARDGSGAIVGSTQVLRYRHQTGSFEVLPGTLSVGRVAHSATLLADGSVLVVGGTDGSANVLASCERIDPVTGASTPVPSLDTPRVLHTATRLADGRVYVCGGTSLLDFTDPTAALLAITATTRVYDPVSNTWSNGQNIPGARIGHNATRVNDGRVLVSGGLTYTVFIGLPIPSFASTAWLYDGTTNSHASASNFTVGRAFHGQTLLPDGRVLVIGGAEGNVLTLTFTTRSDTRIWSPVTNTWSTGASIGQARAYGQPVVVPGNRVVLLGGLATVDSTTTSGTPATAIEVYDVAGNTWSTPSNQLLPRPLGAVALTDSPTFPRILTTGEAVLPPGSPTDFTAELFVP